jgi:GNAT superfamily N-acetyltransferase
MGVWPAVGADLDAVFRLLQDARDWQKARGGDAWREFDRSQIATDIAAGCVHLAKEQGTVRGAVTLVESDPLVWGPDGRNALYLHRLVSSRQAAGRGAGALLIRWARTVAVWRCKKWLRLETWNENRALRGYYENQGFHHVRDQWFAPDSSLPADYRGTTKSLYQIEL